MSKNKGFSDTTANRYSLALYELAEEANVLIKVEENSNSFLKLIVTNEGLFGVFSGTIADKYNRKKTSWDFTKK